MGPTFPPCTDRASARPRNRNSSRPTSHSGNGIRTRVPALRGLCPSPLDDTASDPPPLRLRRSGGGTAISFTCRIRGANAPLTDARRCSSYSVGTPSARRSLRFSLALAQRSQQRHLSASHCDFEFQQARRDLNPQPPVLETGALPIELLTYRAKRSTSATGLYPPSPVSRPPSVLQGDRGELNPQPPEPQSGALTN